MEKFATQIDSVVGPDPTRTRLIKSVCDMEVKCYISITAIIK